MVRLPIVDRLRDLHLRRNKVTNPTATYEPKLYLPSIAFLTILTSPRTTHQIHPTIPPH
ncbi:hypothetical protein TWF703_010731, partial [Orbilia oligospora]